MTYFGRHANYQGSLTTPVPCSLQSDRVKQLFLFRSKAWYLWCNEAASCGQCLMSPVWEDPKSLMVGMGEGGKMWGENIFVRVCFKINQNITELLLGRKTLQVKIYCRLQVWSYHLYSHLGVSVIFSDGPPPYTTCLSKVHRFDIREPCRDFELQSHF